jgi:hypothetical protein
MRESLVRQQQEIAALQAFIDENSVRKKEGQDVNGFLEDMVHQSKLDALAAEERERRRTKELMGVVATVWDYRGKEKQGRSVSRDRNSRDRKSRGREPSSKVEARTDDTSSKVLAGHHQPLPLPGRDGNPRESQIGGSVLLSTFNGLCTPHTHARARARAPYAHIIIMQPRYMQRQIALRACVRECTTWTMTGLCFVCVQASSGPRRQAEGFTVQTVEICFCARSSREATI